MSTLVKPKKWHMVILVVMAACLIFLFFHNRQWPEKTVVIKNVELNVLVADTFVRQHEGWSNKADMDGHDGMLFVFGFNAPHTMVMRGMRFPLDMVWVHEGKIVWLVEGAKPEAGVPEEQLTPYQSQVPSAAVIELKAGLVSQLGLIIGDSVAFKDE